MGCVRSGVDVQNWLTKHSLKTNVHLRNYYILLTSQVEELVLKDKLCNLQVGAIHNPAAIRSIRQVRFILPQKYKDKDSTQWRRLTCSSTSCARTHCIHVHRKRKEHPKQTMLTEQQVKKGVLEGLTPSAAWDTECTPHAEILGEPLIQIEHRSNKILTLVDGHPTPETNIAKLEHRVQEPVLGGLLRFEKNLF